MAHNSAGGAKNAPHLAWRRPANASNELVPGCGHLVGAFDYEVMIAADSWIDRARGAKVSGYALWANVKQLSLTIHLRTTSLRIFAAQVLEVDQHQVQGSTLKISTDFQVLIRESAVNF